MQRVDIVIGVIAAVALTGSLLGVALYDEPEFRRYDVNVVEEEGSADVAALDLTGPGGSDDDAWTTDQNNLTSITFNIQAELTSASQLRNSQTELQVEFTPPEGSNLSAGTVRLTIPADGTSASDTHTIEIQDLPSGDRVLARDEAGALVSEDGPVVPTTTNGTGSWEILGAITSGGGVVNPVTDEPIESEQITVTITADYTYYSAHATPDNIPDTSVL